jgi:glycosyltransferase 2 family protein
MSKTPKHPTRALVINGVLVVVAFSLLGWVIWQKRDSIHKVLSRDLDPWVIALAFAIYLAGLMLTFVRWRWLVRVIDPSFRLRDAFLLGFIGNVYNLVIPGAVGGDLIKAAFLIRMRINSTKAIASMVLDRILGMLGLFILAGVAGALAWPVAGSVARGLIACVWAFLAAGFLGLTAIFTQALTRRYPGLLAGHGRIALILNELKTVSETYRKRIDVVFGSLAMSTINHSCNVVAFYTVSRTMFPVGLPSLAKHFLMAPLTLFTTAVPLPFGALGLTEKVSDELFGLVSHPDGALAMMGFRVLMYAGAVVSVGVYLANLHQVRGLTETAEHLEEELLEGELDDENQPPPEDGPKNPDDGPKNGE